MKRRLIWDGKRGVARCGDVVRRLRIKPYLPELEPFDEIAFWPPHGAMLSVDGRARKLTIPEYRAVIRLLSTMDANSEDAVNGGTTLAVVFDR